MAVETARQPAMLPRHIQNMSEAKVLEPHWGYVDRALPCTNDQGSCKYLDVVYHSHDIGILYCGIRWATLCGILLIWTIGRRLFPSSVQRQLVRSNIDDHPTSKTGGIHRLKDSTASFFRRHLLPEALRPIFGRTTRLQVLLLLVLTGYLAVFSFVGIQYNKWVTPVKNMPDVYITRTSLGPWSVRIGTIAYALTPLSVMLSSRESILSCITGVPYQKFNFLHRWLGYIIFIQSALHTIGCVVEMRLYQPQPTVGLEWIQQKYMIWGVIAMFFMTVLFVLSTPWAMSFVWALFILETHGSLPGTTAKGSQHSYIVRAKTGVTRTLAELATTGSTSSLQFRKNTSAAVTTPVILTGPYGQSITHDLSPSTNVLCVAGGTGITSVLPVLLGLVDDIVVRDRKVDLVWVVRREADILWIKNELDSLYRVPEMNIRIFVTRETRRSTADGRHKQAEALVSQVHHDQSSDASALTSLSEKSLRAEEVMPEGRYSIHYPMSGNDSAENRRPALNHIVSEFIDSTVRGSSTVFASGPGGMISDLRGAVATCNSGERVWKGHERCNVRLVCDDRLEW